MLLKKTGLSPCRPHTSWLYQFETETGRMSPASSTFQFWCCIGRIRKRHHQSNSAGMQKLALTAHRQLALHQSRCLGHRGPWPQCTLCSNMRPGCSPSYRRNHLCTIRPHRCCCTSPGKADGTQFRRRLDMYVWCRCKHGIHLPPPSLFLAATPAQTFDSHSSPLTIVEHLCMRLLSLYMCQHCNLEGSSFDHQTQSPNTRHHYPHCGSCHEEGDAKHLRPMAQGISTSCGWQGLSFYSGLTIPHLLLGAAELHQQGMHRAERGKQL